MRLFEDAQRILDERGEEYPSFQSEAASVVAAVNALLPDLQITVRDYVMILLVMKLRRQASSPKADNIIDLAGYAALWYEIELDRGASEH